MERREGSEHIDVSRAEVDASALQEALLEMDSEGHGRIQREELHRLLTSVGDKFSALEAAQVFSFIPVEDGYVDIRKLVACICE